MALISPTGTLAFSLTGPLQPLADRHAVRLTHERFGADCNVLIRAIRSAMAQAKFEQDKDKPASVGLVLGAVALVGPVLAALLWGAFGLIQSISILLTIIGYFAAVIGAIAIVGSIVAFFNWALKKYRHRFGRRTGLHRAPV